MDSEYRPSGVVGGALLVGFAVVIAKHLVASVMDALREDELVVQIGTKELYVGVRDANEEWVIDHDGGGRPI